MQEKREPPGSDAYGCIQVNAGMEEKTAETIRRLFPEVEAYAVAQIKHRSRLGVRSFITDIMLPGYVVFRTVGDMPVSQLLSLSAVSRILKYDGAEWHLRDADLAFAEWVYAHQGTIGMSTAYREGDRIEILDGPLKTLQGEILRIDQRNRNALVSIGFDRQIYRAWLAFEWLAKAG